MRLKLKLCSTSFQGIEAAKKGMISRAQLEAVIRHFSIFKIQRWKSTISKLRPRP